MGRAVLTMGDRPDGTQRGLAEDHFSERERQGLAYKSSSASQTVGRPGARGCTSGNSHPHQLGKDYFVSKRHRKLYLNPQDFQGQEKTENLQK